MICNNYTEVTDIIKNKNIINAVFYCDYAFFYNIIRYIVMNANINFPDSAQQEKHSERLSEVLTGKVYWDLARKEQIADILEANERIQCYKKDGYHVVIVNATWDLLHPAHVDYLKIIEKKVMLEYGLKREEIKLVCGLEHEDRVRKRKSPDKPTLPVVLRRYMLENQKQVDDTWVYPDLQDDRRPSDIAMMFAPSTLIMHEEYMSTEDIIERLKAKMAHVNTDLLVINYGDEDRLLGHSMRDMGVSTSKILKRIREWWRCEDYFKTEMGK